MLRELKQSLLATPLKKKLPFVLHRSCVMLRDTWNAPSATPVKQSDGHIAFAATQSCKANRFRLFAALNLKEQRRMNIQRMNIQLKKKQGKSLWTNQSLDFAESVDPYC